MKSRTAECAIRSIAGKLGCRRRSKRQKGGRSGGRARSDPALVLYDHYGRRSETDGEWFRAE